MLYVRRVALPPKYRTCKAMLRPLDVHGALLKIENGFVCATDKRLSK